MQSAESSKYLYSIPRAMNKIADSCSLVFQGGGAMSSSREVSPIQFGVSLQTCNIVLYEPELRQFHISLLLLFFFWVGEEMNQTN